MTSRYTVTLNSTSLASVNNAIYVHDILYPDSPYKIETFAVAKRNGARIHRRYKECTRVTIQFSIRLYSISDRQAALQAVCKWAQGGGTLKVNDRPEKQLHCICEKLPTITSAMRWTDVLEMSFVAYEQPYWEDTSFTKVSNLTGTSGSGTLALPGNAPQAYVQVTATANAAITQISFTVGTYTITLSGLSNISSGDKIYIDYDDNWVQSIRKGSNTSLLSKRTGADDLIAIPGQNNTCSFTSDGACSEVEFKCRGLWE